MKFGKKDGNALVEFMIVAPVLLLIFLVLIEIYQILNARQKLTLGLRYALWETMAGGEEDTVLEETAEIVGRKVEGDIRIADSLLDTHGDELLEIPKLGETVRALSLSPKTMVCASLRLDLPLAQAEALDRLGRLLGGGGFRKKRLSLEKEGILIGGTWRSESEKEFREKLGLEEEPGLWLHPLAEEDTEIRDLLENIAPAWEKAMERAKADPDIGPQYDEDPPIDARGRLELDNFPGSNEKEKGKP